ncbi:hypothetical protein PLAN_30164 [Planktothrix rubescens CCAP 1459/22]|uniref:Uncharacterized protein n=1 Tax=Planktothrix rubescens CCAP 1459/22 TaxID=329571 RepID=A0A6J7ZKK1_PLARU|nr:hypothetical protein PLAN_30164 [Planktothrix rubescens NIVA-CYA 18]
MIVVDQFSLPACFSSHLRRINQLYRVNCLYAEQCSNKQINKFICYGVDLNIKVLTNYMNFCKVIST